jgi:ABC-type cobalamin/Fe3+-siderophores transport system ATPase subunit
LPDLGPLSCSGLIVIVGPNSSGKTQLLRDIRDRISGEPRKLVVASEIEVETPDEREFLECLKAEGYIWSSWSDNDEEQFTPRTTYVGSGQAAQNVGTRQLSQWRSQSAQAQQRNRRNEYLSWFSKFLVTVLFLENRLTALKPVGTIDFETQPPGNDLHALHLNDTARAALAAETRRAFSKGVWSCAAKGNQLCLRISDDGVIPSAEERLSVQQMSKYRTIESEGDGMKSYVYTVISLLLGRRPVTIIDEPELCLHPPQAFSLGQFIGRAATSENTTTFVATHSSQILRGVIQTADSLQIVRLTRSAGSFSARHVASATLREAMKKPTVRAETVLDGIFAQAVVIIEADGDRIVYQAAWEAVGGERNFDIHFATAGGTGAIADTTQLYQVLGIPVAVITDLDVLADSTKVRQILSGLCHDEEVTKRLSTLATGVAESLAALPPTLSEEDTKERLQRLARDSYQWKNGDDKNLVMSIADLRSELNGMRALKRGGIAALPLGLSQTADELVRELAQFGFFVVPVGELEEWLTGCGISASKAKKWAWANEAAEYIRSNARVDNDIWKFIDDVGHFLTARFAAQNARRS